MYKIYWPLPFVLLFHCAGAQVAVRNEPRHHNVFENDYIRVLDVFLGPHDTTFYHIHSAPSLFTTLTSTLTGSQLQNGQPSVDDRSKAAFSWYDSLVTPRIHRVWNSDTSWFHVIDIEFLNTSPEQITAPLKNPGLELFINERKVAAYHVKIQPHEIVSLPASAHGYLLISTSDAPIQYKIQATTSNRTMKIGHYIWIESGSPFSATTQSTLTATFLLLQLK